MIMIMIITIITIIIIISISIFLDNLYIDLYKTFLNKKQIIMITIFIIIVVAISVVFVVVVVVVVVVVLIINMTVIYPLRANIKLQSHTRVKVKGQEQLCTISKSGWISVSLSKSDGPYEQLHYSQN